MERKMILVNKNDVKWHGLRIVGGHMQHCYHVMHGLATLHLIETDHAIMISDGDEEWVVYQECEDIDVALRDFLEED